MRLSEIFQTLTITFSSAATYDAAKPNNYKRALSVPVSSKAIRRQCLLQRHPPATTVQETYAKDRGVLEMRVVITASSALNETQCGGPQTRTTNQ